MVEEKLACVWLDNQRIRSGEYLDAQEQLQTVFQTFQTFSNADDCLDFVTDLPQSRFILITSNLLGKILLPLIDSCEQIQAVYIFYSSKSISDQWTNDYEKIKGIFNDFQCLVNEFQSDPVEQEETLSGISFLSCSDDIHRQDPSFMYFQLLKEILLNDTAREDEEETKLNMIDYCRKACADSRNALQIIDEFERTFMAELSIVWYTRECFLYQMLNKALWTPEPDVLYRLRYFLRHLHQQIVLHATSQRTQCSSMILYRGQSMSPAEIKKLKKNVGGFLCFNNFLSTSLDRKVAEIFLFGCQSGVLFEMEVDPTIKKFPFVNTRDLTYFGESESEQELLFSMGSVFRIGKIDKQNHFYRVRLTLSDDVDEQLASYTMLTREGTRTSHSFLSLLRLMYEMGQYGSVDRFALMLQDDVGIATNPSLLGSVYHMFGLIYNRRGQYKESLEHFDRSLNIYLSFMRPDHPSLSPSYSCIGSVHAHQSNYDKALTFFQLALDCLGKSDESDPASIIDCTENIAKSYTKLQKPTNALEYYKRTLALQKQYLGENDPAVAETLQSISGLCLQLGDFMGALSCWMQAGSTDQNVSSLDPTAAANLSLKSGETCLRGKKYDEALKHFQQALTIQQQFLLPNHPSLAITNHHIAQAYRKQDRFAEALPFYLKALEIEQTSLSHDHPYIATSYYNISRVYAGLMQWPLALDYATKSVEQLRKSSETDQTTLASYIHQIGFIHHQQNQYEKALIYYEEALHLHQLYSPEDDPSLAIVYHRTGDAYYKLHRFDKALALFQQTLLLESKTLPENAPTIATTYSSLAAAYLALGQYDEALVSAEQAIVQLRKTHPENHPDMLQLRQNLQAIQQRKYLF